MPIAYRGKKYSPETMHGARQIEKIEARKRRKRESRARIKRKKEEESGQLDLFVEQIKKRQVRDLRNKITKKDFSTRKNKLLTRFFAKSLIRNNTLFSCEDLLKKRGIVLPGKEKYADEILRLTMDSSLGINKERYQGLLAYCTRVLEKSKTLFPTETKVIMLENELTNLINSLE
jgi:hypothetical protein